MSVFGHILPGAWRLSRIRDLDKVALYRLTIVEFYLRNGKKGRLTAKTFGVSTATVYRWVNRYKKWNLASLRSREGVPHILRAYSEKNGY
jgi:transposase